jgi:hypothetical protein
VDVNSASIDETLDWLKSVINNSNEPVHGFFGEYVLSDFAFEQCTITYKETIRAGNGERYTTKTGQADSCWQKTTVPLGAIDPLTINTMRITTYNYSQLNFKTSGSKKAIKQESNLPEQDGLVLDGNTINIANSELADRIQRALKHAVKLCGGKIDPF